MGRKAKPEKFSELYAMYSKELDHAKNKLDDVVKKRALEIGMVAIKVGLGDMSENELIKLFSEITKKGK